MSEPSTPRVNGFVRRGRMAWAVLLLLLKPRKTRQFLVAFVLLFVLFSYWMVFWRVSNEGLEFTNQLNVPPQMRGELVEGRQKFHLVIFVQSKHNIRTIFPIILL